MHSVSRTKVVYAPSKNLWMQKVQCYCYTTIQRKYILTPRVGDEKRHVIGNCLIVVAWPLVHAQRGSLEKFELRKHYI